MPTSITGFAYQRPRQRQGSISSFTYFQDEDETPEFSDEEAVVDVSDEENGYVDEHEHDLEAGSPSSIHRKSSARQRTSSDVPLLKRYDSGRSDTQEHDDGGSFSQKLYIENEDLTMVVAGFQTSFIGFVVYVAICCLTAGLGYLLMRWVPRWRIQLVGRPSPLRQCSWVVVEVSSRHNRKWSRSPAKNQQNQWGEFTVHQVTVEEYGYPMSSVFNELSKEKTNGHRYDGDRELAELHFLDYRYLRFIYHPDEDKFVLNNDWWDPQWTDVKAMREGLDSEEREPRDQVFGKNVIDIKQKSIPELLVDEVNEHHRKREYNADLIRLSTLFTSFRLPVSSYGPWMSITTTHSPFS